MPRAIAHLTGLALGCTLLLPAVAPAANAGGSSALPVPKVGKVVCRTDCAGVRSARPGSDVRLRGRHLKGTESVIFLGRRGAADDVEVDPTTARSRRVDVTVPRTARTGRVAVVNLDGAQSRTPKRTRLAIGAASLAGLRTQSGGPGIDVEIQGKRVFFDGARKATLSYILRAPAPASVTIELVRLSDGTPIRRWAREAVEPGVPQTARWNGKAGGAVQKDGHYEFRVFAEGPDGVRAQSAQAGEDGSARGPGQFMFLRHKFPVRGAHDYGGFAAGFGGGRGHQGHDVFARCGTPLVAARGGTVKHKAFHSRAGHYVVIDGEATGTDYIYMHLQSASPLAKGDRVRTGQRIGEVGDTGRAHGCHLHFELWSAPGWYTGGSAFDPLPLLRAWDKRS